MSEISFALGLLVLFWVAAPIAIFGIYGTILIYYSRRGKTNSPLYDERDEKQKYEPTVTIVLPTYNEASIMPKRIENLLTLDYPAEKLEILFVDDSNDATPTIISDYSKKYPFIRLMRFNQRMGYSPSLIAGCRDAKSEVVVFAEASSFLEPDAIRNLVRDFKNPEIGAVTGKSMLLNEDEEAGKSESTYQRIFDFVRTSESNMDSTIYMRGEAAAVRKDVIGNLDDLGDCPGTADTGIAIYARSKGFRFVFDPRVKFHEYAPSTNTGRVKQKTVRGANLIKVLWHFRKMFFRPKYGKFGMVTLPFDFAMLAFVPVSILAALISLTLFSIFDPIGSIIPWALIGSAFMIAWICSKHILIVFLQSEYSLLKALYEMLFIRKSHDKIDKVASTRRI